MSHPIASQRRSFLIYGLVWLLLIIISIFILTFRQEIVPVQAITDSVISVVLFAILGLLVWYPTRYIPFQKERPLYSILAHAAAGGMVILVWLLISVGLLTVIFGEDEQYASFLSDSVYWRSFIGVMIYLVLILVYYLILYNRSMREQAKSEERLRTLVKESELNMLKSQINPHFLFNSLNSIASLTHSNPEEAREMIIRLSDFMRYSLKHRENEFVALEEELVRMNDYLSIEKIRFGEKLIYQLNVGEECGKSSVPTMILQPLIENAIKHGVYESIEPVVIDFSCRRQSDYMVIEISNDFDPSQPSRKGTGLGLQNVSQRIRLAYDGKGSITWKASGNKFITTLTIPV